MSVAQCDKMRFRLLRRNLIAFLLVSLVVLILIYTKLAIVSEKPPETPPQDPNTQATVISKFQYGSVMDMRTSVYDSNFKQVIQNDDKFPGDPEVVIVVQVHNRPAYLKMLIQSLGNAADIHKFLIIFSHDYFSQEMADIVQGITFCKVLQIYFPYSRQLYPNEFPGQDPKDCPRDIAKAEAIKSECLNAEHPDSYGHYREASITQTKHHWWWKLHFVWERVHALQGFSGFTIFIEEDNYILPDFYQFFKGMLEHKKSDCPDCDMLALGNHDGLGRFQELSGKLETASWLSTKHNIGMGISREVYYKMMGCNTEYCTYDDYNWDWTLQNLSGTCISKPLKVLVACGSRVLHTGDCGMHKKEACRPEQAQVKVQESLQLAKSALFPQTLAVTDHGSAQHQPHMKNGGWGDIRDHALCKNYAKRL
ncbi:alpha-1,6-mannosyl-glycoprotein 2-beta-N-acetylglucosaminyltransferase [Alosa sapidissima]|uniref:alpha-1,6-mannosyl-glycoprotein 2-beta-N-acetylglucosaminyltransferase n=1 Tax=Alosa sapidissima TaxID=34773 RepID=UPI001C09949E|nr:alpha-1,6-mannosyl-glycoprotein 2-beta-N-acetylglucosaminyltransferase [Alosa sapidissima]